MPDIAAGNSGPERQPAGRGPVVGRGHPAGEFGRVRQMAARGRRELRERAAELVLRVQKCPFDPKAGDRHPVAGRFDRRDPRVADIGGVGKPRKLMRSAWIRVQRAKRNARRESEPGGARAQPAQPQLADRDRIGLDNPRPARCPWRPRGRRCGSPTDSCRTRQAAGAAARRRQASDRNGGSSGRSTKRSSRGRIEGSPSVRATVIRPPSVAQKLGDTAMVSSPKIDALRVRLVTPMMLVSLSGEPSAARQSVAILDAR